MIARFVVIALVVLLTPAQITCATIADQFPAPGKALIVRDRYGVAHIYASTEVDLYYAQGFAAARDRARQIGMFRLQAHGRLAEVRGQGSLQSDMVARGFRFPERAAGHLQTLDPRLRLNIEAYARGVNDAILERRGELPAWVEPIEAADVLAMGLLVNFHFPSQDLFRDAQRGLQGSNQFAVAPARSATGHALLSMDPHLYFGGFFDWLEVHLSTPEFSVVGASLPGIAGVLMGHNGAVAWSNTNNYPDLADVYLFPVDPQDPTRYQAADGWKQFSARTEEFRFVQGTEMAGRTETLLETHVGPVLMLRGGFAVAARVAGIDVPTFVEQLDRRTRARTVAEYIEAMRTPGMSMWNLMMADTAGNIGYLYNALSPRRDPGLDWSRPVIGADPRSEWQGFIPFDELPKLVNPVSGWMQNCNDAPWNITAGSGFEAAAMPFRLVSDDTYTDRGRRLTELLSADESVTVEEMRLYATDSLVLRAREWVPVLAAAVDAGAEAPQALRDAMSVLNAWDFHAEPESTGMALFHRWHLLARPGRLPAEPIPAERMQQLLTHLATAAQECIDKYGRLDPPWGQVLFFKHGRAEFSVTGGSSQFNVVRTAFGVPGSDGRIPVNGGSSYQMIVDMAPTPRAWSCFPKGVNEDPDSPHFADMTFLWSRKQYKPVWFTWEELEPNIENQTIIAVPEIR